MRHLMIYCVLLIVAVYANAVSYSNEDEFSEDIDLRESFEDDTFILPHEKFSKNDNVFDGLEASLVSCSEGYGFDAEKLQCLKTKEVNSGIPKKHFGEKQSPVVHSEVFKCPSSFGIYPHERDCSALYKCFFKKKILQHCPKGKLYDERIKRCKPENEVTCGSRIRPNRDDDPKTELPTIKNDLEVTTKDLKNDWGDLDQTLYFGDEPHPTVKPEVFVCPSSIGVYPHEKDCSAFYKCLFKKYTIQHCPKGKLYNERNQRCESENEVTCGSRIRPNRDDDPIRELSSTKNDVEVTTKDKFECSGFLGTGKFEHPDDCSKYYCCTLFKSSLKTCPDSELWDGVKKLCRPANDVQCGTRQRPSDATTEEITTTPISTETPTPPTEPETTTAPPTEPETTTSPPTEPETTTTPPTKPETTTPPPTEPETTTTPPPTEPETTTETETTTTTTTEEPTTAKPPVNDLFVCPEDFGSYPHPTDKKLFIFCRNWKPKIKKCGQELLYSEDLKTCVHP